MPRRATSSRAYRMMLGPVEQAARLLRNAADEVHDYRGDRDPVLIAEAALRREIRTYQLERLNQEEGS